MFAIHMCSVLCDMYVVYMNICCVNMCAVYIYCVAVSHVHIYCVHVCCVHNCLLCVNSVAWLDTSAAAWLALYVWFFMPVHVNVPCVA